MEIDRLKNLIDVKNKLPKNICELIKSDIFYLLNNYVNVKFENIKIDIDSNEFNEINISISAIGDKLRLFRNI